MEAVRDQNRITVAQGVSDSDGTTPISIQVDSVTGKALASIDITVSSVGTLPSQPAVRDENFVPVAMGVSDTDGVTPLPILVDNRNGYIYADII